MLRSLCGVLAVLMSTAVLAQQSPPAGQKAFEVATIKLTDPNFGGILIQFPGGNLSLRGFTLKDLVAFAYEIDSRQVVNVPKALESERYDVVGKPPGGGGQPNMADARLMMQPLLAERFQLKFHRETREIPIYALTVAKGGPKMKPRQEGDGGPPTSLMFRGTNVPGRNASVEMLARGLQRLVLDRPVIDKTGLKGTFDFDLKFRPDGTQLGGRPGQPPADPDLPDIFTAMQEQLGLKLEAQKGPGEVIVVDSVEKPSEN